MTKLLLEQEFPEAFTVMQAFLKNNICRRFGEVILEADSFEPSEPAYTPPEMQYYLDKLTMHMDGLMSIFNEVNNI